MVEGSSLIHDGYIGTLCSSRYLVVAVAQLLQELTYPLRCVRGPERHGTTQLHPEPGRAPWQRRRVLRGELRGRRGRCAHTRADMSIFVSRILMHRGVEQRQLVGLITQRSRVRIPPPLPCHPRRRPRRGFLFAQRYLWSALTVSSGSAPDPLSGSMVTGDEHPCVPTSPNPVQRGHSYLGGQGKNPQY
jgi:hypothetical protein